MITVYPQQITSFRDGHTQDHRANFNHFQRIKTKVSVYNVVDIDNKRITRKPPY